MAFLKHCLLYNLESKGLVKSREKKAENGRKRRYYRLTASGKKKLETDREQWTAIMHGMKSLGLTRGNGNFGQAAGANV